MSRQFVFLYPIVPYIDFQLERDAILLYNAGKPEGLDSLKKRLRELYSQRMNACISERYRRQGFGIHFVLFRDTLLSPLINKDPADQVHLVDMDFLTHSHRRDDGGYSYPNMDKLLEEFGEVNYLRIAGFHFGDCVDKLARIAYERGINTLVDEDLTELFIGRMLRSGFKIDTYPSLSLPQDVLGLRRMRPWLVS